MNFLISIMLVTLLILYGAEWVKKHPVPCYVLAGALALAAIVGEGFHISEELPYAAERLLWYPIARGSLGTAFFVAVMYAGAVPDKSPLRRQLMPLRRDFSIIGGILVLGHNLSAGQEHFVKLFTDPMSMTLNYRLAAVCSLVLMAILIPLWVTSFPAVRKKMKPKSWKKLQRLAYGFYGLTYIHVMLLFLPMAQAGKNRALVNVAVYSIVFLGYAGLRIGKALGRRNLCLGLATAAAVLTILFSQPMGQLPARETGTTVSAVSSASRKKPQATQAVDTPEGTYRDGVYEGKGKGYAGPIRVQVAVSGGVITDITVLSHDEDSPYWERALTLIDDMLARQDAKVDTVVSATKSCKGLRKAVQNALKQAEIE